MILGTVHGCFIPVAGDGFVAAIHVLDGGTVAVARCFVHAIVTGVIGVVAVIMRPTITVTGHNGGDSLESNHRSAPAPH